MLNKNTFNLIFPLTKKQPWLDAKVEELTHLLTEECTNDEEQELMLSLLDRFRYISSEEFHKLVDNTVRSITTEKSYSDENTVIVAMTMDSSADSAQYVLYAMKPYFQKYGWNKPIMVNRANKVVGKFPQCRNVVYVDEFIGTGKTILGRIRTLRKELGGLGFDEYTIRVYAVAASSLGSSALEKEGVELCCENILERGISDYYKEEKDNKVGLMKRLESLLSKQFDGRDLPSLGYGEVEALYAREHGNTPNSVFPIFWWPFYDDESRRPTLLVRSMGDA